jgi:hypothetical protein
MTDTNELPECNELGCEKHRAHRKGSPLTSFEIELYKKHGYFGGVGVIDGKKRLTGINYWQSPLR